MSHFCRGCETSTNRKDFFYCDNCGRAICDRCLLRKSIYTYLIAPAIDDKMKVNCKCPDCHHFKYSSKTWFTFFRKYHFDLKRASRYMWSELDATEPEGYETKYFGKMARNVGQFKAYIDDARNLIQTKEKERRERYR